MTISHLIYFTDNKGFSCQLNGITYLRVFDDGLGSTIEQGRFSGIRLPIKKENQSKEDFAETSINAFLKLSLLK